MTAVGEAFTGAFGPPDLPLPSAIRFRSALDQEVWSALQAEIGAGWFMDRFLLLFGGALEPLERCLAAWDFLVPVNRDRIVLGRNAYGAIVALDDANALDRSIHVLDPFRVAWWTHPDLTLPNLVGTFLPQRLVPHLLDDALYRSWRSATGGVLGDDEILAARKPLGLGGEPALDNVQVEDMLSYYQTTAPVYRKAYARMGRGKPAPGRRKR